MRVVIDTNVLISGIVFNRRPEEVIKKILGEANMLVISPYIINETNRHLKNKFNPTEESLQLFQAAMNTSRIVYFDPYLKVVADEPDNRVLETAVIGKADYLVTGDKQLLELKQYEGIKIVTPAGLLDLGLQN